MGRGMDAGLHLLTDGAHTTGLLLLTGVRNVAVHFPERAGKGEKRDFTAAKACVCSSHMGIFVGNETSVNCQQGSG